MNLFQTKENVDTSRREDVISWRAWSVSGLVGLLFAWPLLYLIWLQGPEAIIRCVTGDAYHYLAIARKAQQSGIYTYDGVHVTNGFHPLWQYFLRGLFTIAQLVTHAQQAIASIGSALVFSTIGVTLTAAAIIRFTRVPMLAMLVVPGVYYLVVGVHVRSLAIWTSLDGMESAFSVFFGGMFFFVASWVLTDTTGSGNRVMRLSRSIGMVLPFLILSRLDDFFILPALAVAIYLTDLPIKEKFSAIIWMGLPSSIIILIYLIYNYSTVGSAMPLSGSTKAGFVGPLTGYLLAGIHFPPLFDIKAFLTGKESDGRVIMDNSFRYLEMFYPILISMFAAAISWRDRASNKKAFLLFAVALYIAFKCGYNFLFVHPWHQSGWYYLFMVLSISVFAAIAAAAIRSKLGNNLLAERFFYSILIGLSLLSAGQFYGEIAYHKSQPVAELWQRKDDLRAELVKSGVTGIVNFDDGITAFLLDFPTIHGFAFATDKEAQKAEREGSLLTLANQRHINAIVGQTYMAASDLIDDDENLRAYLKNSIASSAIRNDLDRFRFSLLSQNQAARLPVIGFIPMSIKSREK